MTEELKRRLVGVAVLLAVFSLIAWWIGARDQQGQDIPSADADVRNYDVRELDRIAAAQQTQQAVAEPVEEVASAQNETSEMQSDAEAVEDDTSDSVEAAAEPAPEPEPEPEPAPRPEASQPAQKPEPAPQIAKPAQSEPAPGKAQSDKPATSANGGWIVQVASVTQKSNANELASRLKKSGWVSFVEEGVVNGTTYYRVRVGPYAARGDADKAAAGLKKELGQNVAVMSH